MLKNSRYFTLEGCDTHRQVTATPYVVKHNRQKLFCLSLTGNLILGADYDLIQLIPVATRFEALVCGRSLAGIAGCNPPGAWMSVSCDCCVLSRRVLCVGLITRPEESYRMCYV
jgi:hypothetical protein